MDHSATAAHFGIPLSLGFLDFSISTPVVVMWCVCGVVFGLLFLANRFHRFRLLEEYIFEFVSDEFASNLKTKNKLWFSFLVSLFLFIFFCNLAGLVPGSVSPTGNINVTVALAISVFLITQVAGIMHHGIKHVLYVVPKDVPWPMLFLIVPIEIVSQLFKPFSLSLRLFANMFAGHMVMVIFLSLTVLAAPYAKIFPLFGVLVLSFFEIFVAFIQAFIFTYLASFYIMETVQQH